MPETKKKPEWKGEAEGETTVSNTTIAAKPAAAKPDPAVAVPVATPDPWATVAECAAGVKQSVAKLESALHALAVQAGATFKS